MAKPSCIMLADLRFAAGHGDMERARGYCEQLERGHILQFHQPPFALPAADREFLTGQRARESSIHKNVSYRPAGDRLRGFAQDAIRDRVHDIMRRYSKAVVDFVGRFLAPYGGRWWLDYASFRPLEEAGRALPLHKRNDLLHVDAFPSRPTHGGRILRAFTNINPSKPRVWLAGEIFADLAPRLAFAAGLRKYAAKGETPRIWLGLARALGLPVPDRSAYDRFMLHFHDWLKENRDFQQNWDKVRLEFPPLATWLVFTDGCPHAVLSGQYALEQTFIVPVNALVTPEQAPIRILERLAGTELA